MTAATIRTMPVLHANLIPSELLALLPLVAEVTSLVGAAVARAFTPPVTAPVSVSYHFTKLQYRGLATDMIATYRGLIRSNRDCSSLECIESVGSRCWGVDRSHHAHSTYNC